MTTLRRTISALNLTYASAVEFKTYHWFRLNCHVLIIISHDSSKSPAADDPQHKQPASNLSLGQSMTCTFLYSILIYQHFKKEMHGERQSEIKEKQHIKGLSHIPNITCWNSFFLFSLKDLLLFSFYKLHVPKKHHIFSLPVFALAN